MMNKTLDYIIRFLLGDDISPRLRATIGYTSDRSLFHKYNIVIIPSGFFEEHTYGTPSSLPPLPLHEIEGIPLLFGVPKIEKVGATLVTHADLIASSYFLISRYEEMLKRNIRDEHGRFPGNESLPYRAGFIHRPVIDEYRLLLRRWLRETDLNVPEIPKGIRKINLTHDVDAPFLYRSWKGLVRHFRDNRSLAGAIRAKFGPLEKDPFYTFPFLFEENSKLTALTGKEKAQAFYFLKAGGNTRQDKPHYNLKSRDMQTLLAAIKKQNGTIGLHSSYQTGKESQYILREKKRLENAAGQPISCNRHHFLALRQPEDIESLEAANITDDYTMGYADIAGFRLGTSYPVQAINPATRRLSPLTLHPLILMDCTLDDPKYMALGDEEATIYCLELFEQIRLVGGEITLLWHNTSLVENPESYQRKLYTLLLNELIRE